MVYTTSMENYKEMNRIVYYCNYYVLWCTKYKRNVLTEDISKRIEEILKDTCTAKGAEIREIRNGRNYVSFYIEVPPQIGIHKIVKALKSATAAIIGKEFPEVKSKLPTLWTNSYFVTTASDSIEEAIQSYVQNQPNTWRTDREE